MAAGSGTLTSAIEKAVETVEKPPQDLSQQEEKPVEKEEAEETEKVEETTIDEEAEQGRRLVQALKNPAEAAVVIDMLARQAGYTRAEARKEPEEARADINKLLEDELGDELKFLAPKLGKALDKYLDTKLKDIPRGDESLRERLDNAERREIERETSNTHVELAKEYFGANDMPENVVKLMSDLMDKYPPTDPNTSPSEYYKDIFSLAIGKLGLTKKSSGRAAAVEKSQNDRGARELSSSNRGLTPNTQGVGKKMSLKDAVGLALEQVNKAYGEK